MTTVALMSWLAASPAYHGVHTDSAGLLPRSAGGQWLDVGCGPGGLTRVAASRGYDAVGIDQNAGMIAAARRIGRRKESSARFRVDDLHSLPATSAAVVSAVSLLAVLPDPALGLHALWKAVADGGTLLIVEPSATMTTRNARTLGRQGWTAHDRLAIGMWSTAREGRAVDPALFGSIEAALISRVPLLGGMVNTWLLTKAHAPDPRGVRDGRHVPR